MPNLSSATISPPAMHARDREAEIHDQAAGHEEPAISANE
jgi:hypothetical protein